MVCKDDRGGGRGYALSPIDLIPDPIPVLGYVDDVILVPLGLLLLRSLISSEVMDDCRHKAAMAEQRPTSWIAGSIIVAGWLTTAIIIGWWAWRCWATR